MSVKRRPSFFDRIFKKDGKDGSGSESDQDLDSLPPLAPVNLLGYSSTKHKLLDVDLVANLRNLLPPRLQLYQNWQLIYLNELNGASLNTLYRHSSYEHQLKAQNKLKSREIGYSDDIVSRLTGSDTKIEPKRLNGYILIIRDEDNDRFGCYLNENLKLVDNKRYYGNGECFLFKCEKVSLTKFKSDTELKREEVGGEIGEELKYEKLDKKESENDDDTSTLDARINLTEGTPFPNHRRQKSDVDHQIRFKAFTYTGINDNLIYSNSNFIAIGSSNGQNGLFIDKSLSSGVSYKCDTFGNEVLNTSNSNIKLGKFSILNLELWRIGDLD